jgi:hypothetical protein
MKHTIQELVALARHYHSVPPWDPAAEVCEYTLGKAETQRRLEAGMLAGKRYPEWRDTHRRMRFRLPDCRIDDHAFYLQGPTCCDGCFWASAELPVLPSEVGMHLLTFLVSTLAPYYVIYRKVFVAIPGTAPRDPADDAPTDRYARHALSFELTAEEEPYARVLAEEIERTFGYEHLPPEIGKEVIPEIITPQSGVGTTTLYDCLFMGHW